MEPEPEINNFGSVTLHREPSPVSHLSVLCLLSHISCPLSLVPCLMSIVSRLLSQCLMSPFSHLLSISHVSCRTTSVSCLTSIFSRLPSHFSWLPSYVSCRISKSHVSCLFHISCLSSPVCLTCPVSCLLLRSIGEYGPPGRVGLACGCVSVKGEKIY